jgi:predicted DNA-binding protein (MmcQ/YjbR family)
MNIEEIREYCIEKPAVTEGFPFNDTALVFKVAGKMFALLDLSEDSRGITLKCDPELAIELQEQHPEVTPAWHFNKVIMELFYTVKQFLRIQLLNKL